MGNILSVRQRCSIRFMRPSVAAIHYEQSEETVTDYAYAAGAVYCLEHIKLINIEKLEEYMKHITKVGRSCKLIQRKFVRVGEGSIIYNIGRNRFVEMARAAGAVYKIGDSGGSMVLVNLEIFDKYMEQFKMPAVEMKNPLWKGEV